jgi:hypothetical protein
VKVLADETARASDSDPFDRVGAQRPRYIGRRVPANTRQASADLATRLRIMYTRLAEQGRSSSARFGGTEDHVQGENVEKTMRNVGADGDGTAIGSDRRWKPHRETRSPRELTVSGNATMHSLR